MMLLKSILESKDGDVRTTTPSTTLAHVVDDLVAYNIGSLLVCEYLRSGVEKLAGIVTERDLLRAQALGVRDFESARVRDIMSSRLIVASPHDTTATAMRLMTSHRVRHLPLVEQGSLVGIISIGDILKAHHDELELENHCMKAYILGESNEMVILTTSN